MSKWIEAGKPERARAELDGIDIEKLRLSDNKAYMSIISELQRLHKELIELEQEGKIDNFRENPVLLGQYLTRIRLKAGQLYGFINALLDLINDMELQFAKKREELYLETIKDMSTNAAEKHIREVTRYDQARIQVVKHYIDQVKNEYSRYDGICIMLQSRLKEMNTERIMS